MAKQLKFGNGEWYGADGSIIAYNDLNSNYKPLPFKFERGSSATRVNKDGLIEVVGGNQPRVDYKDSSDGVFLLEKAATNYDSNSTNFSTSFMSNSAGIQSSDLVSNIAPDGSSNSVYKISKVTDNSDPYIGRSGVNFTNTSMVFSVWLWTDENQPKDVLFLVYRDGVQEVQTKNITLTTTPTRYFIEASFTTTPSNVTYRIDLTPNSSNQYIYAWGKQVESGNIASSYIPTQGTIQTRLAETASGSGSSGAFNDSQGVLFANIAANADNDLNRYITISDGTTSNRVALRIDTDNKIGGFVTDGTSQASFRYEINTLNFSKVAIKYKTNDFSLFVNGFEVLTDLSGSTPSGLNVINYRNSISGDDFYGKTKEIAYYDEILTDLELETLTSYRTWEEMVKELNLNIIHNE